MGITTPATTPTITFTSRAKPTIAPSQRLPCQGTVIAAPPPPVTTPDDEARGEFTADHMERVAHGEAAEGERANDDGDGLDAGVAAEAADDG